MSELAFAFFDTAIGRCGIVWNERGIAGVQLPAKSERATRDQPAAPLSGGARGCAAAEPCSAPSTTSSHCWAASRETRPRRARSPRCAGLSTAASTRSRAPFPPARHCPTARSPSGSAIATWPAMSAQALGQNPFPIIVPCHRVLAAGGKMGGFSAPGGVRTKLRLLTIEGAQLRRARCCSIACPGRRPAAGRA